MAGVMEKPTADDRELMESSSSECPMLFADAGQAAHQYVASEAVLDALARQLEYYFSSTNLSKDTYLQTLRELNDGYVPVSIISRFGKVQALLGYAADATACFCAVVEATKDRTDLLEAVLVDTTTGKVIVGEDQDASNAIVAIGPISRQPLSTIAGPQDPAAALSLMEAAVTQNTVILRDAPSDVTEDAVKDLLTLSSSCPPIQYVHKDVANCWFVTLETKSRDDMIRVMYDLRSKTWSNGDMVDARLKAGPVFAPTQDVTFYGYSQFLPSPGTAQRRGSNKSNSNNISKKKKKGGKNKASSPSVDKKIVQPPPPSLGEEQFPSLTAKVEVEMDNKEEVVITTSEEDEDIKKSTSDAGSTATTSTSSSAASAVGGAKKLLGGYAAALLKSPPSSPKNNADKQPVTTTTTQKEEECSKVESSNNKGKEVVDVVKPAAEPENKTEMTAEAEMPKKEAPAPVASAKPAWGRGRSFAEVVKKQEEGGAVEGEKST